MFHLLAVYAFKSHWDMENAIKCYAINITFKRERFERINDFSQGSKMDLKLNGCQLQLLRKMSSSASSTISRLCTQWCTSTTQALA